MRVEGYDLHAYCDSLTPHEFREGRRVFAGQTKADAYQQAKKAGWKFGKKGGVEYDLCPACARAIRSRKG